MPIRRGSSCARTDEHLSGSITDDIDVDALIGVTHSINAQVVHPDFNVDSFETSAGDTHPMGIVNA